MEGRTFYTDSRLSTILTKSRPPSFLTSASGETASKGDSRLRDGKCDTLGRGASDYMEHMAKQDKREEAKQPGDVEEAANGG